QAPNIDEWTNYQIEYMLNVTLTQSKSASRNYYFLESLSKEALNLDVSLIDGILLDILTDFGVITTRLNQNGPLDYLLDVWYKAKNLKRLIKADDPLRTEKSKVTDEVLRLSSSYSLILFQAPDMFVDEVNVDLLTERIINIVDKYDGFLLDVIERSIENDSVLDFLNIVIPKLSSKLLTLDYSNDTQYLRIMTIFQLFVSNKLIAGEFYKIDGFHPEGLQGNEFEIKCVLGPLLRISPLLAEVAVTNYPSGLIKSQIRTIHESLHAEHNILLNRIFAFCDKLVRSGEPCRNAFLRLLADIVNKNHLRRGEHADPKKIATDSFMFNLTVILMKLSEPFILDGVKIDKIDSNYLNHENRLIDLSEETKINSTIQEADEYYKDKMDNKPLNFISECFYLMLTYVHYGLGGLFVNSARLDNYIKHLSKEVQKFEEMMSQAPPGSANNPMMKMLVESKLKPLKEKLDKLKSLKLSIEMCLSNRELQLEIFDVIIGSIKYFIRLIEPEHQYPKNSGQIKIPFNNLDDDVDKLDDIDYLRSISPIPFKYYPEMFIEGIINYCHHISKYRNNPMFQNEIKLNEFVEFSIIIMRCPELVSNPHLKSRLIEVLFFGSLPLSNGMDGYMIDIFNKNEMVSQNLTISLLDFYVMVEKTGSDSQFYDKFSARCHIAIIIEQMWKFDFFRMDLKKISQNLKFFVRLIARMLNDTTFLLDESLNHLHTIGACQREIANRAKGNPKSMDDTDEELQKKLSESENHAKSYVQLSNKTINLFNLFTKDIPRSFIIVEIVDRLAGMLNYNLVQLVGPKCNQLKVANPENYQFNPSEMLYQICSIFLNLSKEEEFIHAVARDGRSFNPECFKRAIHILYKVGKIDNEFDLQLSEFVTKCEKFKSEEEEEEMELGEIPDEFLDPLMFTLMKDPVKLPHSKVSMDRSVLKAHLMSDSTDPFNRAPLKLEDVEDDLELKEKINNFISERKKQLASNRQGEDVDGDVDMKEGISQSELNTEFKPIELVSVEAADMVKELGMHYKVPTILIKSLFNLNGRSNQTNSNDQNFITNLESEIIEFIIKPNVDSWKMTPLNSYYRLLTHKLAEYYNLGHILSNDGFSMVLFKINTSLVNADDEIKKNAKFDQEGNIKPLDFRNLKFDPVEKLNRIRLSELYDYYKPILEENIVNEEMETLSINNNDVITNNKN
ncbi:hypothetical protein CANARDRAFT_187571, partial [[Candida] arabinofermentans NRRL YB-2248]